MRHPMKEYDPWFYQISLGSDYGTFTCPKCNSVFHHSPSDVVENGKEIYCGICGNCINELFNETIFR